MSFVTIVYEYTLFHCNCAFFNICIFYKITILFYVMIFKIIMLLKCYVLIKLVSKYNIQIVLLIKKLAILKFKLLLKKMYSFY